MGGPWGENRLLAHSSETESKTNKMPTGLALAAQVQKLCDKHRVPFETFKKRLAGVAVGAPRGAVQCGVVRRGMKKEDRPSDEGALPIPVSKGMSTIGTAVSPFALKVPLPPYVTNVPKKNYAMELVWQSAKVAETPKECRTKHGAKYATEAYVRRRTAVYRNDQPKRRYIDRDVGIAGGCFGPVENPLLDYLQSRVFYCEWYAAAVRKTAAYKFMLGMVQLGLPLLLTGPDGYPIPDTSTAGLLAAYEDLSVPFGHERVLVSLLLHDAIPDDSSKCELPWEAERYASVAKRMLDTVEPDSPGDIEKEEDPAEEETDAPPCKKRKTA
ncbi:hypothetical protein DIPPA_24289 [Diplonema papillatum]|nr:hypothetical protein DIPPA_24289 [Diplonema papillatum]